MSITKAGTEEEKAPIIRSLKGISRKAVITMLRSMLRAVINASLGL